MFAELLDHFKGSLPSDDNLRAYLVRRGFSQTSLPNVIQSFRDTMDLVSPETDAYDSLAANKGAEVKMPAPASVPVRTHPPTIVAGVPMSVSFNGDRLEVSAVLSDAEAVEKLIRALNATKALLPEKTTVADHSNEEAAN